MIKGVLLLLKTIGASCKLAPLFEFIDMQKDLLFKPRVDFNSSNNNNSSPSTHSSPSSSLSTSTTPSLSGLSSSSSLVLSTSNHLQSSVESSSSTFASTSSSSSSLSSTSDSSDVRILVSPFSNATTNQEARVSSPKITSAGSSHSDSPPSYLNSSDNDNTSSILHRSLTSSQNLATNLSNNSNSNDVDDANSQPGRIINSTIKQQHEIPRFWMHTLSSVQKVGDTSEVLKQQFAHYSEHADEYYHNTASAHSSDVHRRNQRHQTNHNVHVHAHPQPVRYTDEQIANMTIDELKQIKRKQDLALSQSPTAFSVKKHSNKDSTPRSKSSSKSRTTSPMPARVLTRANIPLLSSFSTAKRG
jgi:hypothetical protein